MAKKKQRSLNFPDMDSSSLVATTTPLDVTEAPTVYYTHEAWEMMWYVINKCTQEVGWLGLVERDEENNSFLITEIFVPEQLVHGAETDISAEALGKLANDLELAGKDSSQLRYWGHSHVNMGVSPSLTDEMQIDDYLEHADWFIRSIQNKRGESKVDVYDTEENAVFQCVDSDVLSVTLDEERIAEIDMILTNNVKRAPLPKATIAKRSPRQFDNYGDGFGYGHGHGYGYGGGGGDGDVARAKYDTYSDVGKNVVAYNDNRAADSGYNTIETHEEAMARMLEEEEKDPFHFREN